MIVKTRILAIVLVLVAAGLACGTQSNIEPKSTAEQGEVASTTPTPLPIFNMGDVISAGDWELTVLGWRTAGGSQFNPPEEGHTYLYVELTLKNASSASKNVSSLAQMELKDSLNRVYDLSLKAVIEITGSPFDGEISAGESVRGEVGFMVPVDASGFVFVFDPNLFAAGKVFVNLGDTPTQ